MALFGFLKRRSPEDAFADRAMRRLRERGWPHPLRYDATNFAIVTTDRGDVLNLANTYRDLQTYPPREHRAQLDRALDILFQPPPPETFEEASPHLLPIIRNLAHLQAMSLQAEDATSPEIEHPYRAISATTGVLLAVDMPSSIVLVNQKLIQAWGCTFDAALAQAIENIVALSPVRFEAEDGGFLVAAYGDRYDSSRLLLPELFRGLDIAGAPVAIPISRDLLLVAGSADGKALKAMAAFALEAYDADTRPTTVAPLILAGERWAPFLPQVPELALLKELSLIQAARDHSVQTPLLQAYCERQGLDTYIPPLEITGPEGQRKTWTSWREGATHSLPRADAIGLTDANGGQLLRRWVDVEAVCGPFVEDRGLHPSRFTPPPWPSPEAWQQLQEEFTEPA